jgi:tRNA-specific adenosine deaminase 3
MGLFFMPKFHYEPILSLEKTRDFVPLEVLVVQFPVLKTSDILKTLNSEWPYELRHLKRVRKIGDENEAIVCPNDSGTDKAKELLKDYTLRSAIVSKYPPFTDTQFQEWKVHWPLVYHHSHSQKYGLLTRLDYLSEAEERQCDQYVTSLWPSQRDLYDSMFQTMPKSEDIQVPCLSQENVCYIVDPVQSAIVAKASHESVDTFLSLGHCIMKAIEMVSAMERSQRKRELTDTNSQRKQYYCTGFDLYTRFEPCMMCAMALVHSRIRRVFFLYPALPKCTYRDQQVHTHPLLNHHYQVFQVFAQDLMESSNSQIDDTKVQ